MCYLSTNTKTFIFLYK